MFSVAEKFNSSYFWTLVQEDSWMCQLLINCHKFSRKLGSNFGVGLWMISHQKNQWCSKHTAQVWRLSTCLSRWICTTPRSPGCNRNLGLIVTILQLSSQVQNHTILILILIRIPFVSAIQSLLIPHCLHLCCKLTFLISIIFNSIVGVGEVQLFQVSRDPCTTVHTRGTGWRPLSSLPKSLPSLPQSGSQPSSFGVHLAELFAQSSLIKDCDLCSEFCVLLCFTSFVNGTVIANIERVMTCLQTLKHRFFQTRTPQLRHHLRIFLRQIPN